ncbi:MAG: dihydroorotate dehydrogenase electron transfer subunit [bacterium]|nr:dihydroorotate dehydrogenase electron transfer subunit [bacterium]
MSERTIDYDNGPGKVLSNREIAPDHFLMELAAPFDLSRARPGQFVMIRVSEGITPVLRRPFGICSMNKDRGSFTILYRVVGPGTKILSDIPEGLELDILGPLGRGFDVALAGEAPLLIAGGVGVPPLFMLAAALVKNGKKPEVIIGGRSASDLLFVEEFKKIGLKALAATEDGSEGFKGYVTGILEEMISGGRAPSVIYSCGPGPMLKRVGEIAIESGIACQLSLEAVMACGFGVCLGCVLKTCSIDRPDETDYSRVCAEGPVFDAREIIWE